MIKNFMDLDVWREGKSLAVDLYRLLEEIDVRGYYALKDQMLRAAVSIPSNIAEGKERETSKEFVRYLYMAKGSSGELRTQLLIFRELSISQVTDVDQFIERTDKLSRMLSSLITAVHTY